MFKIKLYLIIYITFFVCPRMSQASRNIVFYSLGNSARELSLGGASTAYADGPTALFWNPSIINQFNYKAATFFITNLNNETWYSFGGFVFPTIRIGTFGINYLRNENNNINIFDEHNIIMDKAKYLDHELLLGYGNSINKYLAIGGTFKVHEIKFSGFSYNRYLGTDFGLLFNSNSNKLLLKDIALGLVMKNIFQLKLTKNKDLMPFLLRLGFIKQLKIQKHKINFLFDISSQLVYLPRYHFGIEYIFKQFIKFRMGSNNGYFNIGCGLSIYDINIDYWHGRLVEHLLSSVHGISLTYYFGKSRIEKFNKIQIEFEKEVEKEYQRRIIEKRLNRFKKLMDDGEKFYKEGKYYKALDKFQSALNIYPEDKAAKFWIERVMSKLIENKKNL